MIILELLRLKYLRIKVMNHLLRMRPKVLLIDIQIKQINLNQEQHRDVVNDDTDDLI